MNKNLLIFIIIIFICIIIFLCVYFKNLKKNNDEYFWPWDLNNKPDYVTNYENVNFNVQPNYSKENITQYNFERLFKILKNINNKKIKLNNPTNYNFFTQSTTDDKMRMDLDQISKYVVSILNKDGYYNFSKTNYGDVMLWTDKENNEELKYELFLWDKKNYFEVKLWVHIIKFVNKEEGIKYGIKEKETKYFFPWYNIGSDFKDQIIPGPLDTIITSHMDTGISSINPNEPAKIKFLYLNHIEVQNSTLVVDYHKDIYPEKEYNVSDGKNFSGINDGSLPFVFIKKNNYTPYLEKGLKYNEWPTLDEEPKWKGQYPSKAPDLNWDDDGVYCKKCPNKNKDEIKFTSLNNDKDNERICDVYNPGTRWSEDKEPLQPYFWSSNYTVNNTCGQYYYMFNDAASLPGVFVGGGKR
jgi:hypothetical protein